MLTPTKTGLSTLALAASCGVRCLEVRTSCGVRSSRARRRVSARRAGGDGAWATVLDLDVPGAGRIVGVAMPQGVGVERARADGIKYAQASSGAHHLCAAREDGSKVDCWGVGEGRHKPRTVRVPASFLPAV